MSLEEYRTVKNWLSRLSKSSGKVYLRHFERFYKWLKENNTKFSDLNPDQLIKYQQEATNSEKFHILDLIQNFINQLEGRFNYKKSFYTGLKSFFIHNRAELPRDRTFKVRGDKQNVIGTLTVNEVKNIVQSCNEVYRAVFLSMFQGAIDQEGLTYWNMNGYQDLMEQLQEYKHGVPDDATIKINLPGRKKNKFEKPYYTFIGKDSIEAIKNWLKIRPENAEAIFTIQQRYEANTIPITKQSIRMYWLRHINRLGIINRLHNNRTSNRYGKNVHELRDIFRSLWEKSPATYSVAEYIMGHVVDPLGYNKAHKDENWTRKEYLKAVPYLNIISSGRAFGRVDESDVERLRRELENRDKQDQNLWDLMKEMKTELEELRSKINESN